MPFFYELPRRGFIEGQNLTIYCRDFGPHVDLISEYAAELVKDRVDELQADQGARGRADDHLKAVPRSEFWHGDAQDLNRSKRYASSGPRQVASASPCCVHS